MRSAKALVAKLKATAAVTSLLTDGANGISPGVIPQTRNFPFVTYAQIDAKTEQLLTPESPDLAFDLVQLDCWGATYVSAKQLAEQIRIALDGQSGTWGGQVVSRCALQNEVDIYDGEAKNFRVSLDFKFSFHI